MSSADIRIGTSGWHYKHWVGPVYPEGMSSEEFFAHYARRFSTVEINNTFYQLPGAETLAHWREAAPSGFLFACKASRYITHMKKLKDPEESTAKFFDAVDGLGETLGPILFQLPPHWNANPERLAAFLAGLPDGYRYAFEFRDSSWFADEVYDALRRAGAGFCLYDLAGEQAPIEVTADFVYIRLHGPDGAYQGSYEESALSAWASRIADWCDSGRDVYCYFDNDEAGYAFKNAERLQEMLGE